jgi:hypothetical protein
MRDWVLIMREEVDLRGSRVLVRVMLDDVVWMRGPERTRLLIETREGRGMLTFRWKAIG